MARTTHHRPPTASKATAPQVAAQSPSDSSSTRISASPRLSRKAALHPDRSDGVGPSRSRQEAAADAVLLSNRRERGLGARSAQTPGTRIAQLILLRGRQDWEIHQGNEMELRLVYYAGWAKPGPVDPSEGRREPPLKPEQLSGTRRGTRAEPRR